MSTTEGNHASIITPQPTKDFTGTGLSPDTKRTHTAKRKSEDITRSSSIQQRGGTREGSARADGCGQRSLWSGSASFVLTWRWQHGGGVVVHLTARLGKGVVLVGFAYERSRDKVPSRKDRGRECGDSSSARRGGTRVMVGLGATEEGHLTAEEGDRLGWSLVRLATSNGEGRVQRRCHVGTVEWKRVRGSLSPVERRKKRGGRRK
jgi:hypothetical protein